MNLSSLSSDILRNIFKSVSLVHLLVLERTCRRFHSLLNNNYWERKIRKYRNVGSDRDSRTEFLKCYEYYRNLSGNIRINLVKLRIHYLKEKLYKKYSKIFTDELSIKRRKWLSYEAIWARNEDDDSGEWNEAKSLRQILKEQIQQILTRFPNNKRVIELKELKEYRRQRYGILSGKRRFIRHEWPSFAESMKLESLNRLNIEGKLKNILVGTIIEWTYYERRLISVKLSNNTFAQINDLRIYLEKLRKRHQMTDEQLRKLYEPYPFD